MKFSFIYKLQNKITRSIERVKEKRKLKSAIANENRGGYDQTELNLLLLSHSLEKGMGIENTRIGFGKEKAKRLLEEVTIFTSHTEMPEISYAYNEAMSVLKSYIQFTTDNGVVISEIEKCYEELNNRYAHIKQNAGYEIVDTEKMYREIKCDSSSSFLESRHSFRSYDKRPVEKEIMEKILMVASSAPSACNRQPIKVFWTNSNSSVARLSEVIPGNKGFENEIPNWAIIAVDRAMFGEQECLQWYVNGGIYASYLVLAMHAFHIGSCIFQIPISWNGISDIRTIAGIPNRFSITCAIGFGYPKDKVKCLCSARKPVSEYNTQF